LNVLLDTHTLLWAIAGSDRLSLSAKSVLTKPNTRVYVSVVSCAEIACHVEKGRLTLPVHWKTWFRMALEKNGWTPLPLDLPIMEESYSLPGIFHVDPVDRALTATARIHGLTLITADRKILSYPHVNTLW